MNYIMEIHRVKNSNILLYFEGILSKGPYLPCVSMVGRALLTGYHRFILNLVEAFICIFSCTESRLYSNDHLKLI